MDININVLKNSLKAVGITVILSLILLILFNIAAYNSADPDKMITPLAYSALIISMFVCGLTASKFEREKKFICSAIAGGIYIFLIFVLSIVFGGESDTSAWLTFVMYIVAIGGVMSGALAENAKRKVSSVKTRKNLKNKYTQKLRRKI